MKKGIKPEASVLGQLLLMQNILINLPDENSILSFVCKGLEDIPGVKSVHFLKEFKNNFSARIIHFPIGSQKDNCGSLRFKLDNVQSFQVYAEYVQNFVFMIQIILMERNQRRLNNQHKLELEERVKERTIQLSNEIDEHKQAEQALIESEERFRKISENAPVLINSFDKDGRCLFWNEQCNKTFGWTIEEINEHEVPMELFYPDPAVCEEVISTVSSDPDGSFREWHPVTKDGKILSTMWANFSLHNGQVFSMGYDITEYKKIENDLRKSAEIFERWKSSNFIGILQSNAAGDVIDANDAILKMLGYSKQELTEGKLDWTKLTPTEFLQLDQKAMEEASEKGTWTPFEKEYFHKDGKSVV